LKRMTGGQIILSLMSIMVQYIMMLNALPEVFVDYRNASLKEHPQMNYDELEKWLLQEQLATPDEILKMRKGNHRVIDIIRKNINRQLDKIDKNIEQNNELICKLTNLYQTKPSDRLDAKLKEKITYASELVNERSLLIVRITEQIQKFTDLVNPLTNSIRTLQLVDDYLANGGNCNTVGNHYEKSVRAESVLDQFKDAAIEKANHYLTTGNQSSEFIELFSGEQTEWKFDVLFSVFLVVDNDIRHECDAVITINGYPIYIVEMKTSKSDIDKAIEQVVKRLIGAGALPQNTPLPEGILKKCGNGTNCTICNKDTHILVGKDMWELMEYSGGGIIITGNPKDFDAPSNIRTKLMFLLCGPNDATNMENIAALLKLGNPEFFQLDKFTNIHVINFTPSTSPTVTA
jgi:hypothetical protein